MSTLETDDGRGNAQILLFLAGGLPLGVFMAEVGRLVLEEDVAPVPFSHPAMAGLLVGTDVDPFPVFDLRGLGDQPPPRHVHGARVALFSTQRGPIGLRMDTMIGARHRYRFVSDPFHARSELQALPQALRDTLTSVATIDGVGGGESTFFFFSPDAFLAQLDLARASRPDEAGGPEAAGG